MARLNISKFPDDLLQILRQQAHRERRSVAQEVIHLLDGFLRPERYSILELRGLGKELWQGANNQTYINNERDGWDEP
jgi:plasmid stability protein